MHDGATVPLGGRRQRSLLAILLLRANKVVSADTVIDELWGEQPPDSAQHTLHAYVSRLRKSFRDAGVEQDVLVSYPAGYLLRVESGQLDLERFERLANEGRRLLAAGVADQAGAACRTALALWNGPALADLRFEPFARVDVERLEEQRLGVLEDRIEADLDAGRHAALVAELEALVAEHPLRERLREELMLALYRTGRRAEALEAYRDAHIYLVEECGLEPGRQLRTLHQAMLAQDPDLDLGQPGRAPVLTTEATADELPVAEVRPSEATEPARDGGPPVATRRRRPTRAAALAGTAAVAVVVVVAAVAIARDAPHSLAGSTVHANSVVFVDGARGKLLGQVDTGGRLAGVAAGFDRLWVADSANARVLVLDPSTFRTEDQVPLGRVPTGLAAAGNGVWVIDAGSSTVSKISAGSHTVVATVNVGTNPSAIAAGAAALWVADASNGSLTRIDPGTATVADTISVGQPLTDVTVGLGTVWATSTGGQLIAIDPRTNRVTQAVPIGAGPAAVRVAGGAVWVANPADGTVSRFDPGSGAVRKIGVPTPTALAVASGRLWVADGAHATLTSIDPASGRSIRVATLANPPAGLASIGDRLAVTIGVSANQHRGGTLHVVAGDGVDSIDPGSAYSVNDWELLALTNDGLLTYSRTADAAASALVPDLATSLPVVDDAGRTFTFKLRHGIRYSDGTPVRPADFRRGLERQYQAGTGLAQVGVPLTGAERCGPPRPACDLREGVTVDDAAGTVAYHLSAPDPAFLYQLALPFGAAVPSGAPGIGPRTGPLPATGPYVIASYVPNRHAVLSRNPRFQEWSPAAQPPGFPDRITVQLGLEPAAQVDAVTVGRADVMLDTPPPGSLAGLLRDLPRQLHTYAQAETDAIFLNTRIAPFDRSAVRQAIALAVDRSQLVELAGGPQLARATCQILPPGFPGYYPYCPSTAEPDPAGVWHRPDLSRARALIAASGTAGAAVTVSTIAQDPFKLATGRYFVRLLDALGYRARLRTYADSHAYYDNVGKRTARSQVGVFGWFADFQAGAAFFAPLFTCSAYRPGARPNLNPAGYCDRTLDAQIAAATSQQNINVAAANRAWRQIDAEVTRDAPWVPMVNPLGIDLVSARVGNYQRSPAFGVLVDQLWVR